jgi:alpha-galactosidase
MANAMHTRTSLLLLLGLAAAVCALAADVPILTPPPSPEPRIHGARVYGTRPGRPFLYTIPATGLRPMTFSAKGLPKGLKLDPKTGIITGSVAQKGEFRVRLGARNTVGSAERDFRIVAGDKLALTPPMGWSTWYMAYTDISDKFVREQADAMASSGLIRHGYAYVNIDDGWNIKPGSLDPALGGPPRDAKGNLRPNGRFPDMKAMCDYVHSQGLKIGIYISPGPSTCAGYEGSYQHEEQDARQFAAWGFDFLKYDWCSYGKIARDKSLAEIQKPYRLMGGILEKLDRDFVFNLCQYGMGDVSQWGREVGGHYWRTTGDLGDQRHPLWQNMSTIGFGQAGKEKWAGPGGWNDPDNILIGHIIWDKKLRPTPLAPDEQYTYVSLWSLLSAPLILGGDMTRLDDFTLGLLTNDEVIDVNQDTLGRQAVPVFKDGNLEVWAKDLEDGSKAMGLFNRGEEPTAVTATWSALGIQGRRPVRDLWRQKDLGVFDGEYRATVAAHGVALVRVGRR